MNPKVITIDRLDLDLRGLPPEVARAAVESLGPAIGEAVAAARFGRHPLPGSPAAPQPRVVRLGPAATAVEVRAALAAQVAVAIAPSVDRGPTH